MKNQSIGIALASHLQLPAEVLTSLPLIQLVGAHRLQIQNFHTVSQYTPEEIVVICRSGKLAIHGCQLSIQSLYEEELTITGRIQDICFLDFA